MKKINAIAQILLSTLFLMGMVTLKLEAQNPTVDLSFDGDGKWFYSDGSTVEKITDVITDAAGKTIAVGYTNYDTDEGGKSRGVVFRLLTNGTPDPSFGVNGKVDIDFPNSTDEIHGVALDNSGNIVLCGKSNVISGALYKLLASNGALDASFGTGGRSLLNAAALFYDLAVLPNGKIVTVGWGIYGDDPDFLIAQFNANGSIDTGYGTFSGYTFRGSLEDEFANALAVQADGKVVVTGYQWTCSGDNCLDPVVARFLSNGQIDSGFSFAGGMFSLPAAYQAEAYDVAIQNVGGEERILVSGYHEPSNGDGTYGFIARIKNNGNMDAGFGGSSSGLITLSAPNLTMSDCYVSVQSDNKILLVSSNYYYSGASYYQVRIMRRNVDGTLDTSFGSGGIFNHQVSASVDDPVVVKSIGNKIYVAGSVYPIQNNYTDQDGFVSRYLNCSSSPQITLIATNPSCNLINGTISASIAGGGSFNYLWSNGQTSATIQNLAGGTYTVTVSNTDGCSATATKTLTANPVAQANVTTTNAKCGQNNGTAKVTWVSGAPIQFYLWNTGSNSDLISSLAPGTYTVTITDINQCTIVLTGIVAATPLPSYNISVNATTCGNNNGQILVTPTGGPSISAYIWNNGATTAAVSNLQASTYTVTMTDANQCTFIESRSLASSTAVLVSTTPTNASCGLSNGNIVATASGSTSFTYSWSNGQTGASIQNLMAGTYTVTVTGANSCSKTKTETITSSPAALVNLVSTNSSCNQNNGVLTAQLVSGPSIAVYNWSNGATTQTNTNLAPGAYSVSFTDVNGCSGTASGTVSTNPLPTVVANFQSTTCGLDNGQITVTQTAGPTILSYQWSNGQVGTSLQNLAAGTYTVTMLDVNNCTQTQSYAIASSSVATVFIDVTNTACGMNNGNLCASAVGGNPIVSYQWSNGSGTTCIFNLAAGTYSVTATDNAGCTTIKSGSVGASTAAQVNLGPDLAVPLGSTVVLSAAAPGIVGYAWSTGATSANITVGPGVYVVTVTNSAGCTDTDDVVVNLATSSKEASVEDLQVKIFPNPVSNYLNIQLEHASPCQVILFDALGREVLHAASDLWLPDQKLVLDMQYLSAGIYYIRVLTRDGLINRCLPIVKA